MMVILKCMSRFYFITMHKVIRAGCKTYCSTELGSGDVKMMNRELQAAIKYKLIPTNFKR